VNARVNRAELPHGSVPFRPYVPARRWRGGHRMTIYTWARRRPFPSLPVPTDRYFDVAERTRVLAHCYWQPAPARHPTLVGLHGLEGSSSAHYMRGLADKGFARGWNVVLLNQRNCGGTEALCDGLYHSGLTADPRYVIDELVTRDRLPAIAIVGYSLGGNLALKLAGEYGARTPAALLAVCAVSPTLDLGLCVVALERHANLLYQWNFVRNLKARMRRKAALFPDAFDLSRLPHIRTVRAFDEAYTAPHHGFRDAADYYHRASALRTVDRIVTPSFIIASKNDPFVPAEQFRHRAVADNPHVHVCLTDDGGHCGFVADARDGYDGYWAEQATIEFAAKHLE
jgi:uncharacterized protein